jgi:stalled ribosome alternative rescue factor ArfA
MESEKEKGDGRRDPKKRKGKGSEINESNNQLRNTWEKEKRELIFQRDVPKKQ